MMSHEEREQQNLMAKQIAWIIKMWPVWLIIVAIFSAGITMGVKFINYDNNTAKKSDIDKLVAQNAVLSKQVSDLTIAFYHSKAVDSIERTGIKSDLKADILTTNRTVGNIEKKLARLLVVSNLTSYKLGDKTYFKRATTN